MTRSVFFSETTSRRKGGEANRAPRGLPIRERAKETMPDRTEGHRDPSKPWKTLPRRLPSLGKIVVRTGGAPWNLRIWALRGRVASPARRVAAKKPGRIALSAIRPIRSAT
jgi:hypothetical protein